MADVARLAGVSSMTVSRVLSGGGGSPEARLAVEAAVKRLGYQLNLAARALASSRAGRRQPRSAAMSTSESGPIVGVWQPYAELMLRLMRPNT